MNILQALDDPNVFGQHFRDSTWDAWRVFLCALFALPMSSERLAIYQHHTRRSMAPAQSLHEHHNLPFSEWDFVRDWSSHTLR